MPAVARMASADEYYQSENHKPSKVWNVLDWMDFAERYADYVVSHEKWIDRSGLASIEFEENRKHRILYPRNFSGLDITATDGLAMEGGKDA